MQSMYTQKMATNKTQSCLVTGGAGFIGSHLCKSLLDDGYKVICVDNLSTGSEKNIDHLNSNKNFTFKRLDVVQEWSSVGEIDYIFHLASPASPVDYQNLPEETALVNSMGTIGMLKQARVHGAKFLLASTSEVYGDPLEHPQKETYWGNSNSFGPRSCYDEGKRFAETMTYIYINKYNLDARVIRIFNTYGPKMKKDDGRVVSNFINWAIRNESIRIDGDGSQTRSFCYVDDLVVGIKKAMFTSGTRGEVFNLGNPEEFTVKELAAKVIELTNSQSRLEFTNEFRKDDPMQRRPDITKAGRVLNWKPVVSLHEGLELTIDFYRKEI